MNSFHKEFLLTVALKRDSKIDGQVMYADICTEGTIITPKFEKRIRHFLSEDFEMQTSTLENYIKANSKPQKVVEVYGKIPELIFLTSKELDEVIESHLVGDSWARFKEKFPNSDGISDVSALGVSDDEQEILMYHGTRWGDMMGVGQYILYQLKENQWIEKQRIMSWIS